MSAPKLILIRHAQSEWNASERWQGLGDPPLSRLGREQALGLAAKLADERVDRFFCSDLLRARETAAALADQWDLEPTLDERLRELDIGEWEGLTRRQIQARDAERLAQFDTEDPSIRPGGGESRAELRARARLLISDWIRRYSGERIAVVTHMGFVRALLPGTTLANAEFVCVDAEDARTRRGAAEFMGRVERGMDPGRSDGPHGGW